MFMILMLLNCVFLFVGIFIFKDHTLYLIIPGFIMVLWAQFNINSTFNKWREVPTGMTGKEIAEAILAENGIEDVMVEHVEGTLSDHYDPRSKIIRLSESTYNDTSVAAIAVAAHEVGHAIQHHNSYAPLIIRNTIAPVVGLMSNSWGFLILAGFFFSFPYLIQIGIVFYSAFFLFSVVTLPVEFDASKRAITTLEKDGHLTPEELPGAKKVLNAAALTYVAGALMTLLQLIRLILIFKNDD